jgi:hypothetical protein
VSASCVSVIWSVLGRGSFSSDSGTTVRTSGAVRFKGFLPVVEPALVEPAVPALAAALELSTQCPVSLKHTGSVLLPADWPAGASPAAGGAEELVVPVVEAGGGDEGADEAVEPGVAAGADADCPAAGASWACAAGVAARTAAARAVARVAFRRPPGAAQVAKFAGLPIDPVVLRLTFICHGASVGRDSRLLRPAHLAQQSPCPCLRTPFAMAVADH